MTYTENQLTPWMDGKPPSVGVWEVKTRIRGISVYRYSYFDGEHWNGGWSCVTDAFVKQDWYSRYGNQGLLEGRSVKYRGLNFDPEQQL